jgi:SAM-dependent methyltransferase
MLKTDLWDEVKNTRILQWVHGQGAAVFGVDISEPTVRQAAAAFADSGLRGVVSDVRRLPFRDGSFDAVYSMGTIEHFPDPETALLEMHRVLRPGGRAVVGVPNRWDPFLRPLFAWVLQKLGLYGYGFERSQGTGAHDCDCHLKLEAFWHDHANGASCVAPDKTLRKQTPSIARFYECKLQMHVVDFGCDRRGWPGFVENAEKRGPQQTAGRIENPLRRGHRLPCWRPPTPRSTFLDDYHAIRGDNVDKERGRQTMGIRSQHDREIELTCLDLGEEVAR